MKKQFDVVGMGELLIDFTDSGMSEQERGAPPVMFWPCCRKWAGKQRLSEKWGQMCSVRICE